MCITMQIGTHSRRGRVRRSPEDAYIVTHVSGAFLEPSVSKPYLLELKRLLLRYRGSTKLNRQGLLYVSLVPVAMCLDWPYTAKREEVVIVEISGEQLSDSKQLSLCCMCSIYRGSR